MECAQRADTCKQVLAPTGDSPPPLLRPDVSPQLSGGSAGAGSVDSQPLIATPVPQRYGTPKRQLEDASEMLSKDEGVGTSGVPGEDDVCREAGAAHVRKQVGRMLRFAHQQQEQHARQQQQPPEKQERQRQHGQLAEAVVPSPHWCTAKYPLTLRQQQTMIEAALEYRWQQLLAQKGYMDMDAGQGRPGASTEQQQRAAAAAAGPSFRRECLADAVLAWAHPGGFPFANNAEKEDYLGSEAAVERCASFMSQHMPATTAFMMACAAGVHDEELFADLENEECQSGGGTACGGKAQAGAMEGAEVAGAAAAAAPAGDGAAQAHRRGETAAA